MAQESVLAGLFWPKTTLQTRVMPQKVFILELGARELQTRNFIHGYWVKEDIQACLLFAAQSLQSTVFVPLAVEVSR